MKASVNLIIFMCQKVLNVKLLKLWKMLMPCVYAEVDAESNLVESHGFPPATLSYVV